MDDHGLSDRDWRIDSDDTNKVAAVALRRSSPSRHASENSLEERDFVVDALYGNGRHTPSTSSRPAMTLAVGTRARWALESWNDFGRMPGKGILFSHLSSTAWNSEPHDDVIRCGSSHASRHTALNCKCIHFPQK